MNMLDSAAIGAIEQQLAQRVIDHYRIDLRLLIFDATNFDTFINSRTVSALAQRGHAKSKRADLRILGLALPGELRLSRSAALTPVSGKPE